MEQHAGVPALERLTDSGLWRNSADFSPPTFSQRFTGTFSDDGKTIDGRWGTNSDGSSWEHDFGLTYTKIT
jgi:hypothetical protein